MAAANARGGGVKRQPATTARMPTTSTHSSTTDPSNGRVFSVIRRDQGGVTRNRFSAASASKMATSTSLIERMMPYLVSISARKLSS